jgi:hypothetical protein
LIILDLSSSLSTEFWELPCRLGRNSLHHNCFVFSLFSMFLGST